MSLIVSFLSVTRANSCEIIREPMCGEQFTAGNYTMTQFPNLQHHELASEVSVLNFFSYGATLNMYEEHFQPNIPVVFHQD